MKRITIQEFNYYTYRVPFDAAISIIENNIEHVLRISKLKGTVDGYKYVLGIVSQNLIEETLNNCGFFLFNHSKDALWYIKSVFDKHEQTRIKFMAFGFASFSLSEENEK